MLEAVHPVLMCRDVTVSIRFYERLGFAVKFQDSTAQPKYAAVRCDGVELHLHWADESQWASAADRPVYRILVDQVDALYAKLLKKGAVGAGGSGESPWRVPGNTPWGTREFHLLDPAGNGLQFYRGR